MKSFRVVVFQAGCLTECINASGMPSERFNNIKGGNMTKKAGPGSANRIRSSRNCIFLFCGIVSSLFFVSEESSALPVFARKYHTSCSTCHIAFPVRNGFGEAFRNNGYRFPAGADEDMVKEEPIKLGQDAYKKVFPDAIWPSDMPNMPSLGFLAKARIYMPEKDGKFKETKFAEDLETFFAGTITDQITYFGDFAINQDGIEWGKLNLLWAFRPGLNLVLGEVGFTEKMTLIAARPGWKRDGYAATMPTPSRGVEIRFAGNTGESGGYSLAAGIGKNSTEDAEDAGNFTDSKFVRGTFKIGGHGLLSGVGGTQVTMLLAWIMPLHSVSITSTRRAAQWLHRRKGLREKPGVDTRQMSKLLTAPASSCPVCNA